MIVNPNGTVSVSMTPNYALTPLSYQPINMLMQMLQQMQGTQLAPPQAPAPVPEMSYSDVDNAFSGWQPKGTPYAMGHGQAPAQAAPATPAAPAAPAQTAPTAQTTPASQNNSGWLTALLTGAGLAELIRRSARTHLVGASVVPQEALPAGASAAGTSIKPVPPAPTPSRLGGPSPKGLPPAGAAAGLALEAPAQGVPVTWETPTASAAPVKQPPTVIDVAATPVTPFIEPSVSNVVNAAPPTPTSAPAPTSATPIVRATQIEQATPIERATPIEPTYEYERTAAPIKPATATPIARATPIERATPIANATPIGRATPIEPTYEYERTAAPIKPATATPIERATYIEQPPVPASIEEQTPNFLKRPGGVSYTVSNTMTPPWLRRESIPAWDGVIDRPLTPRAFESMRYGPPLSEEAVNSVFNRVLDAMPAKTLVGQAVDSATKPVEKPTASPKEAKQTTTTAAPAENLQSLIEEYNKVSESAKQLRKKINMNAVNRGDNIANAAYGAYQELRAKETELYNKILARHNKITGGIAGKSRLASVLNPLALASFVANTMANAKELDIKEDDSVLSTMVKMLAAFAGVLPVAPPSGTPYYDLELGEVGGLQ